jgi:putative transposase
MQTSIPLEPGHYYHIYNRGNNRENIFIEERNYRYFMQLYQKYILPVCDTFAYCLMRNHFHVLVRVKELQNQTCEVSKTSEVYNQNNSQTSEVLKTSEVSSKAITQQFSNFFNSYAKAINTTYKRTGSLFQNRFGRVEVDSDRYFAQLIHYIHFNPQKHGFVDDFRQYPYSSYPAIVSEKPTRLCKDEVLNWFQGKDSFVKIHDLLCDEAVILHLTQEDFD